jgi:8-hydroxy-5-deazaflavin:NADPH oxidoreductase
LRRLAPGSPFDPLKAGGLEAANRIEGPGGDLNQFGLNGQIVDLDQARAALTGGPRPR